MTHTNGNGPPRPSGEIALAVHGYDGRWLMKLAQRVATDWLGGKAATLQSRREDLVSFLVVKGLEAAIRYDSSREHLSYGANGGDPFQSYIADVMERRIVDFYRRKSEGFGDRRHGFDGRIVLTGEHEDADPDIDFDKLVSERRLGRWQEAAASVELDLREWILITLDRAARELERAA